MPVFRHYLSRFGFVGFQFKHTFGVRERTFQLDAFIADLVKLFEVIADTALLEKTIHIMQDVLHRMESKKDLYGTEILRCVGQIEVSSVMIKLI